MDRLEEKMSIAARASRDAREDRATMLGAPLEGSDLYIRQVLEGEYSDDLMRRVWAGTPWMVNAYTGRSDERRRDEIYRWCLEHFGNEAFPFGDEPRPGRWREGSATVFGWTWFGFSTEAEMRKFQQAWPDPAPDDTGSERGEHREAQKSDIGIPITEQHQALTPSRPSPPNE